MKGPPIASAVLTSLNVLVGGMNTVGSTVRENYRLHAEFRSCLSRLKQEVCNAEGDLLKFEGIDEGLSMELLEHLCSIEDYVATLALPNKKLMSFLTGKLALDTRPIKIKKMECHLLCMKATQDRMKDIDKPNSASTDILPPTAPCFSLEKDLGQAFEGSIEKLHQLLSHPADGTQMRRISIVGSTGLGKSCLAKAVYEASNMSGTLRASVDNCKIWINASLCNNADDVLNDIMKQAQLVGDGQPTYERVKSFLLKRSYLVIIDGLWSSAIKWNDLGKAFPENDKNSRIIVTTAVCSVALDWSSGRYYIYDVQCLRDGDARDLFWKAVCGGSTRGATNPEGDRSRNILDTCAGLPIALVSAGSYVCCQHRNPFLSSHLEKMICAELKNVVTTDASEFSDLRRKFVQCYQSMKHHDERVSFLCFSMYPYGYQISKKSFARKLEAENLVTKESAMNCLDELINKSLICNAGNKCRMQGMMLQFATYKASAINLVTVVVEGQIRLNKPNDIFLGRIKPSCRRLVVHCSKETSNCPIPDECDPSTIRSLTVFKSNRPKAVALIDRVNFKRFKVMRVLDLEGCHGFKSINGLDSICELRLLRFLNLKNSDVEQIPNAIEKLTHLETIDIRGTLVHTVPIQLITLPQLAIILGVFVLPVVADNEKPQVTAFLKSKSKLQTLEGLHINKTSDFDIVIRNAKSLNKIKISGESFLQPSAPAPATQTRVHVACDSDEERADPEFIQAVGSLLNVIHDRSKDFASICVESSVMSKAFICHPVMNDSALTCLKLQGRITSLPAAAFENRNGLTKICLYRTGLTCEQIVDGLQTLKWLEHLYLGKERVPAAWAGVFSVKKDRFPALRELRFKGPKPYPQIKIEEGGMNMLASLELFCRYPRTVPDEEITSVEASETIAARDVEMSAAEELLGDCDIRVEGLGHLKFLDEVNLHYTANNCIVKAWEAAARSHSNFPSVIRQGKWATPVVDEL